MKKSITLSPRWLKLDKGDKIRVNDKSHTIKKRETWRALRPNKYEFHPGGVKYKLGNNLLLMITRAIGGLRCTLVREYKKKGWFFTSSGWNPVKVIDLAILKKGK